MANNILRDAQKAVKILKSKIKFDPEDVLSMVKLANLLCKMKDYDQSILFYQKALQKYGYNEKVLFNLGIVYGLKKDYNNAVVVFNKILKKGLNNVKALYALAFNYGQLGEFDVQVEILERIREVDPEHLETLLQLGNLYKLKGLNSKAINCFLEVIKLNPNLPEAYSELAKIYEKIGKLKQAFFYFQEVLRFKPTNSDAKKHIFQLYQQLEDSDKKRNLYKQIESLNIVIPEIAFELAHKYYNKKEYDRAILELEKIIEIEPESIEARTLLAELYLIVGDKLEARFELEALVDSKINYIGPYLQLSELYLSEKKVGKAKNILQHALLKFPDNLEARYKLALILKSLRELDSAEFHVSEALRVVPNNEDLLFLSGEINYFIKNYDKSAVNFLKLTELNENNFKAWLYLAKVNLKRKLLSSFFDNVERIINHAPLKSIEREEAIYLKRHKRL